MRLTLRYLFVPLLLLSTSLQVALPARAGTSNELDMLALVNDARGDAGIHPVELDPRLTARAERNSSGMARTHRLSHSGHLRAHMGECVGAGPSLRAIMRAFMRSPEHRRIILNRHYRSVGVGVAISRGTYWVTLTFD